MDPVSAEIPKHFLHPCTIFAHRQEHWVSTVLGSCVAVCLWDPAIALGGINHYMLPLWNGEGLPTPKYGNIAIEKLIEKMLFLGARKERLIAKVFGGANVLKCDTGPFNIGERNIIVARERLESHGIQIAASELGGTIGLRILYNTKSGTALVARLRQGDPRAQALPDGRPKV